MSDTVQIIIKRVGDKYKAAPKQLKITIGEILAGKIKLQESINREENHE